MTNLSSCGQLPDGGRAENGDQFICPLFEPSMTRFSFFRLHAACRAWLKIFQVVLLA
jgi:hypothetical protein